MPFVKAEQFKVAEGFVSLGGAYEEPENPQQAQISKIARQVMTRLHIQVNQTIQFYRGQQGGSAPVRLFLAGGASIMPYTAQFFSEKLNLPVEYFNPLRNIQIDPAVNLEELAKVAHSLGEVVGLGLRNLAQCPIELNLMPKSIRKRQALGQKKPYFIATVASIVLALFILGWFYDTKILNAKRDYVAQLQNKITPLQDLWDKKIAPAQNQIDQLKKEADQLALWTEDRILWIDIVRELRLALLETERIVEQFPDLRQRAGRAGVWIEKLSPDIPGKEDEFISADAANAADSAARPGISGMSLAMRKRYGLPLNDLEAAPETPSAPAPSTNEIVSVPLTCTAVNLMRFSPTANGRLISILQDRLRVRTNLFIPEETKSAKEYTPPETNSPTFNFGMTLKLRRPIKI